MATVRRLFMTLFVLLGTFAAGIYGWRQWDLRGDVQFTADAYVRGEITALAPRVAGYVVAITADENTSVAAHEVLVQIDPRDYRLALQRAQAAVAQAQAQRERAQVQRRNQTLLVTAAEAAVASARAQETRNEVDLGRARDLRASGTGTQVRLEDAAAAEQVSRASLAQAQAALAVQRQVIEQVDADERLAAATLASAGAAEISARLALEDTGVWTAIAGVVSNRRSRVGEYVTPGTRMLSVVPIEGLWIEANFRETQLARMAPDQPVAIRLDTYPRHALCGYVESIGVASGSEFALFPPDNATGNFTKIVRRFPVRIRVNAMDPGVRLPRAGMSAEVRVGVTGDVGCHYNAVHDRQPASLPRMPYHPGLDPRLLP
ncbi:MAG: HlyD family secretion protein [Rubritepida sp.]|nr:HlyD family secretion protein [Rubritepida sp.]